MIRIILAIFLTFELVACGGEAGNGDVVYSAYDDERFIGSWSRILQDSLCTETYILNPDKSIAIIAYEEKLGGTFSLSDDESTDEKIITLTLKVSTENARPDCSGDINSDVGAVINVYVRFHNNNTEMLWYIDLETYLYGNPFAELYRNPENDDVPIQILFKTIDEDDRSDISAPSVSINELGNTQIVWNNCTERKSLYFNGVNFNDIEILTTYPELRCTTARIEKIVLNDTNVSAVLYTDEQHVNPRFTLTVFFEGKLIYQENINGIITGNSFNEINRSSIDIDANGIIYIAYKIDKQITGFAYSELIVARYDMNGFIDEVSTEQGFADEIFVAVNNNGDAFAYISRSNGSDDLYATRDTHGWSEYTSVSALALNDVKKNGISLIYNNDRTVDMLLVDSGYDHHHFDGISWTSYNLTDYSTDFDYDNQGNLSVIWNENCNQPPNSCDAMYTISKYIEFDGTRWSDPVSLFTSMNISTPKIFILNDNKRVATFGDDKRVQFYTHFDGNSWQPAKLNYQHEGILEAGVDVNKSGRGISVFDIYESNNLNASIIQFDLIN